MKASYVRFASCPLLLLHSLMPELTAYSLTTLRDTQSAHPPFLAAMPTSDSWSAHGNHQLAKHDSGMSSKGVRLTCVSPLTTSYFSLLFLLVLLVSTWQLNQAGFSFDKGYFGTGYAGVRNRVLIRLVLWAGAGIIC